jgi:two-component system, OmpR family, response regulator QseB
MRLLLIEDDTMLGAAIRDGLRAQGLTVDWVREGLTGLSAAATEPFDLVLLDLGLPRLDGLDVLRMLREQGKSLPVIILTARDTIEQRVEGLNAGADDYVLKPFDVKELAARIRAVTRRHAGRPSTLMRSGEVTLDPVTRDVRLRGEQMALSAREFSLLEMLMHRPGVPLTRAQIEDKLYGWGEEVGSNTVEVFVHSLRRKLGSGVIQNVRGVGYFVPRSVTERPQP